MQNPKSFVDRIYYDGHREYTVKRGEIAYLDGSRLARPAEMPRAQRVIALVFVVIAIIIGGVMVNDLVISKIRASADNEQAIVDNLAREASIESIPNMASLINLDNNGVKAALESAGNKLYDATGADDSSDMILYRIPSDMSASEVASLYLKGIGSLEAAQASKLLNGSWYFAVDRVGSPSMVVRYADFKNSDPQVAVQDAFKKEGFDSKSVTDQGIDESGNTYMSGTVDAEGTACTWKISSLPLSEVYTISGLPEDACYVGVRVTAQ